MKAMFFPYYGSQFVGMGKELYDTQRLMQEYFEEAAICLSMNFVKLCFASSEAELAQLNNAYTSLFLVGASSAGLLRERGIQIDRVVGVDIVGWYSALFAARSISLPDGLYILNKYAQLYDEFMKSDDYKLFSSGLDFGAQAPLSESFAGALRDYLEKIDIKQAEIPVISPLSGEAVTADGELKKIAKTIFTEPISIDTMIDQLRTADQVYMAIPAQKIRSSIENLLGDKKLITMETAAEFAAITQAPEAVVTKEDNG